MNISVLTKGRVARLLYHPSTINPSFFHEPKLQGKNKITKRDLWDFDSYNICTYVPRSKYGLV